MSFIADSIRARSDADLAAAVRDLGDARLVALFASPPPSPFALNEQSAASRVRAWVEQNGATPFKPAQVIIGASVSSISGYVELRRLVERGSLVKVFHGLYRRAA